MRILTLIILFIAAILAVFSAFFAKDTQKSSVGSQKTVIVEEKETASGNNTGKALLEIVDQKGNVRINNDDIEVARAKVSVGSDGTNSWVELTFTEEGKDKFARVTEELKGEAIYIYVDRELISAPIIREVVTNGKAVISGNFTYDEAKLLAARIRGEES